MTKSEIDRRMKAGYEWIREFCPEKLKLLEIKLPKSSEDDDILYIDLINYVLTTVSSSTVEEEDFVGEDKLMKVLGCSSRSESEHSRFKVIRSFWNGFTIEVEPGVWILLPREMTYESN